MSKISKISVLIAGLFLLAFNVHAQKTFTKVKSLKTVSAHQINENSAVSGGIITMELPAATDSSPDIKQLGICWSMNSNPTVDDSKVEAQAFPSYSAKLTNLIKGKTYFVRAYVITKSGEKIYGDVKSFQTPGSVND